MPRNFHRALPPALAWVFTFAAICAVQWWQADAKQQGFYNIGEHVVRCGDV